MTYQIIAERPNSLLIYENGKTKLYTADVYNMLKFKQFNGERIILNTKDKKNGKVFVQETYDRGIFNVEYGGETLQIRDTIELSKAIDEYLKTKTNTMIKELFLAKYREANYVRIMELMAKSFGKHVKVVKGEFVIHDMFMVDKKGSAHYKSKNKDHVNKKLKRNWKYLCIVPKGKLRKMRIKTKIGEMELTRTDVEIMAKVGFLLYPDINDSVFMNQLPKVLQEKLKKIMKDEMII